jgi:uncharacterized membrane protein
MASAGTGNRKGKRISRNFLIAVSIIIRHNNSMKIEIPDTTIQALKNNLQLDQTSEVNLADLEYKINDLITEWVSELAWLDYV